MSHASYLASRGDKQLEIGKGGGDSKDKLILGGLVAVIVIAIGSLVWSFTGGNDSVAAQEVNLKCLACGHEEGVTKKDVAERYGQLSGEEKARMTGVRVTCPQCKDPRHTMIQSSKCPKCEKLYYSPTVEMTARRQLGLPTDMLPKGPVTCPHCGVDVRQYYREAKGRR